VRINPNQLTLIEIDQQRIPRCGYLKSPVESGAVSGISQLPLEGEFSIWIQNNVVAGIRVVEMRNAISLARTFDMPRLGVPIQL